MRPKRSSKEFYKTLAYSDIFDYPLTSQQLFSFLGIKIKSKDFLKNITFLPHKIVKRRIYYFLPKREDIVQERIKRFAISQEKIKKTLPIATMLSAIPTIRFIGMSGSLAMQNATKNSDSDLFFITMSGTVWLSRFFVYALIYILGVKKRKINTSFSICANMFVDEKEVKFALKKRNIYTAHEIAQLYPLHNKDYSFEKFFIKNVWIKKYFPNFSLPTLPKKKEERKTMSFSLLLFPLEHLARIMQTWYMRSKITRETLSPTHIAFHPIDYEGMVLKEYEKRLKKYKINYSSRE